ncbi:MAG: glycosyltransferase family 2 protein [Chlamydiia bacterium]
MRVWLYCMMALSHLGTALTCSMLIPCHHRHAQYLPDLLHRLEQQTRLPDEVVISLSGIAMLSRSVLKDLTQISFPRKVRWVLHNHTVTRGGNRNAAASKATGDILICQDADDAPHPQRIEAMMRVFEEFEEVEMVLHGCAILPHAELNRPGTWHLSDEEFQELRFDLGALPLFPIVDENSLQDEHHPLVNGVPGLRSWAFNAGMRWIETPSPREDCLFNRKFLQTVGGICFLNLPLYHYWFERSAGYDVGFYASQQPVREAERRGEHLEPVGSSRRQAR